MKKKMKILAVVCSMALSGQAQVLFPQADLYDTGAMMMYINAARETARARMENYERCTDLAIEAYNNQQWSNAINYVNSALETGYQCGMLYYIRGFSYEGLGYLKNAKDDYKQAKKMNYADAVAALARVELRIKEQK